MNFRFYTLLIIICYACWSCHQGIMESPMPSDSNVTIYHGDIYIACDNGPLYRFSLDSLITNCSSSDTFQLSFPRGIQTNESTCAYDGNLALATSDTIYDFALSRDDMKPSFTDTDIEMTVIPYVVIGNDTIPTNEYPFYGAYQITQENDVLKLYIYNAYVGGCLHDKIVWYLERY